MSISALPAAALGGAGCGLLLVLLLMQDPHWSMRLRSLLPAPVPAAAGHLAAKPEAPEELLLRQLALAGPDALPPAAAGALHAALARLREAAGQPEEALRHYRQARDLAAAAVKVAPPPLMLGEGILWIGKEREDLFEARLNLAQACLAHGRLEEADREAQAQLDEVAGLDPAPMAAAFRVAAQARRELGQPEAALRLLRFARERLEMTSDPEGPDELVRILSDAAESHLRIGTFAEAQEALEQATKILRAAGDFAAVGPEEAEAAKPELGSVLHRVWGDLAFASKDAVEARGHYRKALRLEARVRPVRPHFAAKIEESLERLQQGLAFPYPKAQAPPVPPKPTGAAKVRAGRATGSSAALSAATAPLAARVESLLAKGQAKQAEADCLQAIEKRSSQEGTAGDLELAAERMLLGRVYCRQSRYLEASAEFSAALAAALRTGGAGSAEAAEAYRGLGMLQVLLHSKGQGAAAKALYHGAVQAAEAAGVPVEDPERQDGERRLRANAAPSEDAPLGR